jgi:ferredoxin
VVLMRISVEPGVCVASGQCYLAVPEVFDLDDEDGTVVLLDATPSGAVRAAAWQAVQNCPSGALSVVADPQS